MSSSADRSELERARQEGRDEERRDIVAWLRSSADRLQEWDYQGSGGAERHCMVLADDIEAGEHWKP